MNETIKDGGPAFPGVETTVHMAGDGGAGYETIPDVHSIGGMNLRDYFIAHAPAGEVQGMIPSSMGELAKWLGVATYVHQSHYPIALAKARCMWADAMLAAREAHS